MIGIFRSEILFFSLLPFSPCCCFFFHPFWAIISTTFFQLFCLADAIIHIYGFCSVEKNGELLFVYLMKWNADIRGLKWKGLLNNALVIRNFYWKKNKTSYCVLKKQAKIYLEMLKRWIGIGKISEKYQSHHHIYISICLSIDKRCWPSFQPFFLTYRFADPFSQKKKRKK